MNKKDDLFNNNNKRFKTSSDPDQLLRQTIGRTILNTLTDNNARNFFNNQVNINKFFNNDGENTRFKTASSPQAEQLRADREELAEQLRADREELAEQLRVEKEEVAARLREEREEVAARLREEREEAAYRRRLEREVRAARIRAEREEAARQSRAQSYGDYRRSQEESSRLYDFLRQTHNQRQQSHNNQGANPNKNRQQSNNQGHKQTSGESKVSASPRDEVVRIGKTSFSRSAVERAQAIINTTAGDRKKILAQAHPDRFPEDQREAASEVFQAVQALLRK